MGGVYQVDIMGALRFELFHDFPQSLNRYGFAEATVGSVILQARDALDMLFSPSVKLSPQSTRREARLPLLARSDA